MEYYKTMTDEKRLKQVGAKLRAERMSRGLTQEQVAKKAGITANHYALVERGVKDPTSTTMSNIIKAIGTTHQAILDK